jgi:pimeloyl-ACP methyl ester carboxylesterase
MTAHKVNGIEIDAEELGEATGVPLLLIRGLGTQRTAWPVEFPRLVARAPGPQRTPLLPSSTRALYRRRWAGGEELSTLLHDDMASMWWVRRARGETAWRDSMGGMIAQPLAARHGERLRSLTRSVLPRPGRPTEAAAALMSRPRTGDRESVIRMA